MKMKQIFRSITISGMAVFVLLAVSANNAFAVDPSSRVIAPYWQHAGSTYTFIGVAHPSLSGMASDIGVTVTAFLGDGGEGAANIYGTSQTFTVSAGQTSKIFVFGTNLQTSNSLFNEANFPNDTVILGSTTAGGTGYIRFDPVQAGSTNDVTRLSYWGAVVFSGSNTGFAMEFIGDMNDSSSHPGQAANTFPSGVN